MLVICSARYLETGYISPIEAMRVVMKSLNGHFAFMVLVAGGKCLMVGCRDYPLVIGKNDPTVYFATDAETLALFSPSKTSVHGNKKPVMFCATLSQSELILPVPL
jgi:glucosamine 6-phosphate synthetase-like amidotransferase/phosphosugar isomerase protein